jgi:hypothetical protein
MSAMPILLVSKGSLAEQDEGEGDGRTTPLSFDEEGDTRSTPPSFR